MVRGRLEPGTSERRGNIKYMRSARTPRVRGPNDPARRERIAEAARVVVARRGVEGVTHRAVAAEAGVPLGSTTYHFATLDDLLAVALEDSARAEITKLRAWEANLPPDADFAAALSELASRYLGEDRRQTIVEYELYVAALHRPNLRAVSAAWDAALVELFSSRTDPLTGRLLAVAFSGLLVHGLLEESEPTLEDLDALFRRALRTP